MLPMSNCNQPPKLKIGLFIDTFFPMVDGVVMVVDNYARRMSQIADVTVFTTKPRTKFDDSILPYKVVRCPILRTFGLDYDLPLPNLSHKFKKTVFNSNLDIVHIHSPFGIGKIGIKYAKKNNIPVVGTMHSKFKRDFLKETHNCKWLTNLLLKSVVRAYNKCDECWAVNQGVANIYYHEYGTTLLPIVRNNATDLKLLEGTSFLPQLRKKYNITDDEKVFLFVGRLSVLKNIEFILQSLKIVKEKGVKFKMLLVGTGPDEQYLKNITNKLNLDNNIIFLGKITDRETIARIFALSDLFLFPSTHDCSSLVQIEAASQKTPTLFLAESTTADSVTHNKNGYLAPNSTEEYANEIIRIFSDPKQYNSVCEGAYNDLYISWDDAVTLALKDYERLINNNQK